MLYGSVVPRSQLYFTRPGLRALPANICPLSRSILCCLGRVAVDSFSHHPHWKSRPKPQADTDRLKRAARNRGEAISNENKKDALRSLSASPHSTLAGNLAPLGDWSAFRSTRRVWLPILADNAGASETTAYVGERRHRIHASRPLWRFR